MTHALLCDGCGRLASDSDPTDGDPARRWWSLLRGPAPGGIAQPLLLGVEDGPIEDEDDEEPEEGEPERHFCSEGCLRGWIEGRG